MASKWSWLALGVGAYLAIAFARFPAETAYRWFAPDTLRLARIDGTVWSGSAGYASVPGLPLTDLRWRLDAWPLLLGRVAGDFEARLSDGFVSGSVVASAGRVRFAPLRASASLEALREVLPIHDTRGQASFSSDGLVLVDGFPETGGGTLRLGELQVAPFGAPAAPMLVPLGSFAAELRVGDDDRVVADVEDTGGPLEVNATLTLGRDGIYALEGVLRTRPEASGDLVQAVELMTGEPDAQGMRPLNLSGSL